jgi:hypothetical protein
VDNRACLANETRLFFLIPPKTVSGYGKEEKTNERTKQLLDKSSITSGKYFFSLSLEALRPEAQQRDETSENVRRWSTQLAERLALTG